MAIITDVAKTITIPGEDATVDIRMVSWLTLDKAQAARMKDLAEAVRTAVVVGGGGDGAAVIERLRAAAPGTKPDRFLQYDKYVLLKHGVVSWTYPVPVDPEALDPATAEYVARAILDYSLPDTAAVKAAASPSNGS